MQRFDALNMKHANSIIKRGDKGMMKLESPFIIFEPGSSTLEFVQHGG